MTTESKHFSWSTKAPLGFHYLFTPPPPCCSTANTIETETRCVVISSRDAQSGNHVTAQKDKELGGCKEGGEEDGVEGRQPVVRIRRQWVVVVNVFVPITIQHEAGVTWSARWVEGNGGSAG